MNRDFKGVWIPKEIWLNENLKMLEKVILVEIDSLDNENHCTAGNEYFANFCSCSLSAVTKTIKHLKELGYIEELEFDGRHRKLRVVKNTKQGSKIYYAESENLLANNTNNNLTRNNKVLSKDNTTKTRFEFGKQKQGKESLYTKCANLIRAKSDDNDIQKLLFSWLDMLLEKYKDRDRVLYTNVFKGKLNMLDKFDTKDWKEIIEYNLQKGYEGFYPLPVSNYSTNIKDKPWEVGVSSAGYTDEEKRQNEKEREEMIARGERVWF